MLNNSKLYAIKRLDSGKYVSRNHTDTLDQNEFVALNYNYSENSNLVDSKIMFDKIQNVKPRSVTYIRIRNLIILFGVILSLVFGSLIMSLIFWEIEKPEFVYEIDSTSQINGNSLQESNIVSVETLNKIPNLNDRKTSSTFNQTKEITNEIQIDKRLMGISFEFVIIATWMIFGTFLIYRNTDWFLVKNRRILIVLILLIICLFGSLFLVIIHQNNGLPRAARSIRNNFRELRKINLLFETRN